MEGHSVLPLLESKNAIKLTNKESGPHQLYIIREGGLNLFLHNGSYLINKNKPTKNISVENNNQLNDNDLFIIHSVENYYRGADSSSDIDLHHMFQFNIGNLKIYNEATLGLDCVKRSRIHSNHLMISVDINLGFLMLRYLPDSIDRFSVNGYGIDYNHTWVIRDPTIHTNEDDSVRKFFEGMYLVNHKMPAIVPAGDNTTFMSHGDILCIFDPYENQTHCLQYLVSIAQSDNAAILYYRKLKNVSDDNILENFGFNKY